MEIYMDLLVILNFAVDLLLLYGTNKLAGFPGELKRTAAAAAVGAAYAGLCVIPGFSFMAGGLWRLISFGIMSGIAFGFGKSGLRRAVVFFLLSMALGGLTIGIGSRTLWTLVLAGAGLWLLCLLGFGGGTLGSTYIPVTILHKGNAVHLTALVDTGNTLKDPMSGKPVLVVADTVGRRLLSISTEELADPLKTLTGGRYPGLRLIPYKAVGQPAGMLLGLKAEQVLSAGKPLDVIVAFAPQRLGQGRPYEALAGGNV